MISVCCVAFSEFVFLVATCSVVVCGSLEGGGGTVGVCCVSVVVSARLPSGPILPVGVGCDGDGVTLGLALGMTGVSGALCTVGPVFFGDGGGESGFVGLCGVDGAGEGAEEGGFVSVSGFFSGVVVGESFLSGVARVGDGAGGVSAGVGAGFGFGAGLVAVRSLSAAPEFA